LKKGFAQVYSHAKKKGLLVTVFTNGTLINDTILALFENLPPYAVEITLYGATVATYEKITGVNGSYDKCIQGIRRLREHQINLRLKTILMEPNRHEFNAIRDMADGFGVKFRFDATIFPCFNGDKSPLGLRVSPDEAIQKEFSDPERLAQWKNHFERVQGWPMLENLYQCGTGLTSFHIDPYGYLQPCLMATSPSYDLRKGPFLTGWQKVIPQIREKKSGREYPCQQCAKKALCGFCPAFFRLENGAEESPSEYLCAMGKYRLEAIENDGLLSASRPPSAENSP